MYEEYWGLREKPFANTPDPRYLFFSRQHEEGLTRLLYAITEEKGGVMLTGDYGCGKTLLSRTLLQRLDPERYEMAMLPHPNLAPNELLQEILRQFGSPFDRGAGKAELLYQLRELLRDNLRHGRRTIILVDEAQMVLDQATLEEIRLLLNFQEDRRFLLTLALMGQPEFLDTLDRLPQLKQRLSIRFHLGSLSEEDARAYIRHRLAIAGCEQALFDARAEAHLVRVAGCVPRRINNLADMALLVGFGQKLPIIDEDTIRHVAADLEMECAEAAGTV